MFWKFNLATILIFVTVMLGCSSNGNAPVQTDITELYVPENITQDKYLNADNHELKGIWELNFDDENLSITVEPSRELAAHFNITSMIPPPEIQLVSWNPTTRILEANVTITNPFSIVGRDLRLIVYYSGGNNPRLVNDDGWTSLFDVGGGYTINPFKAYAKQVPMRKFEAYAVNTESLKIYFPSGLYPVPFAIEVSYPQNCAEPYMMTQFTQTTLYDVLDSECDIAIDVHDWQNDVSGVYIAAPWITGQPAISLIYAQGQTWEATIINSIDADAGVYPSVVWASSIDSGSLLAYTVVYLRVTPIINLPASWGSFDFDYANEVVVDKQGNILIVGDFHGDVDFDPGSHVYGVESRSGTQDAYFLKLDTNGCLLKVLNWGGHSGDDSAYGIALDSEDYIFITGSYEGTADLDPSENVFEFTSHGGKDCYVMKLFPDGLPMWIQTWGGTGDDIAFDVAVDLMDFAYIAGSFEDTVDFKPGGGYLRTSNGFNDAYIIKYSYNGSYQWAGTWGGTSIDQAYTIDTDPSCNSYVAGKYNGSVDFDPSDSSETIYTANGIDDVYLSKFSLIGDFLWAGTWGANYIDSVSDLIVFGSDRIYLIGSFAGSVDFDPSSGERIIDAGVSTDTFITIFDDDRNIIDVVSLGGDNGTSYGYGLNIYSNELFACGSFSGTVDFNPGVEFDNKISFDGTYDAYLVRLDLDLNYDWSRTWGGNGDDRSYAVVCDQNMYTVTVGVFKDLVDFDPGPDVIERTSNGEFDAFATKYDLYGNMVHQ